MAFYDLLVFIHVVSAILGLGPGFMMIYVVQKASTMTQLKHAYHIRGRIHLFVMIGGTLLLITGLWMGFLRPYLFKQVWFTSSLILFLIALGVGPTILSPKAKPIKRLLYEENGEEIPTTYYRLSRQLFFYERITNVIFLIIITLMIFKPH